MKIFLPFKIKDIGGTSTFVSTFSKELEKRNVEVVFDFCNDFDILFIIADCPLKYVFYAKWKKKKIVQRLDGVYNFAANGWIYPLLNMKIKVIYNWFSDVVIYQSRFSKYSCKRFLGKTRAKKYAIIYNGVDTEKIKPRGDVSSTGKIKLLTFAKFRRRDQIEPIVESVKLLDPKFFSLDIYGAYTKNLQNIFSSLSDNINFKGKRSSEELLKIISQYDIFIFSDQSACPNSVLEAMAAGLAICAFNRGSINELVKMGYNGEIVLLEEHDSFIEKFPFKKENYQKMAENIKKTSQSLASYKNNALERSENSFKLKNMSDRYLNLINEIISKKHD